jgi:hypothetical protein
MYTGKQTPKGFRTQTPSLNAKPISKDPKNLNQNSHPGMYNNP